MKYKTLILHNGNDIDRETGALSIPVYKASTYRQNNFEERQHFEYSRSGNPTREALEKTLAVLESGNHAYAFSSGMAAIASVITALFRPGDHLIVTRDIYGGAYRFFTSFINEFGVKITFADFTDLASVEREILPETKGVYIESPSNPLMKVIDLEWVADMAIKHKLVSIIDNTFMSPALMRPLEFGIDVSIHSGTKFLGGHSDLLCGAAVVKDEQLAKKIYFVQNTFGAVLSPDDSWLLMRGIKTLHARMKMQEESASRIAVYLKGVPWARDVYYPGLTDHPGHEILKRQASGFGAVLSFRADSVKRCSEILKNVKLWAPAVSLGGVESIVSYPCMMSHAAMPASVRGKLGITDDILRLSAGLEDADDLIEDLKISAGV